MVHTPKSSLRRHSDENPALGTTVARLLAEIRAMRLHAVIAGLIEPANLQCSSVESAMPITMTSSGDDSGARADADALG